MTLSRRKFLLGAGTGIAGGVLGGFLGATYGARPGWRLESQIPRAEGVATSDTLPDEADVVVIGGGIAGLSTALFLNQKGFNTVVLEKGVVAGEQSSRAFGWVYSNHWDLGKLELANRSKAIWQGFASRFGEDIGFRQTGNYSLLASDDDVTASQQWLDEAKRIQPQTDARLVTGGELDRLLPSGA
ncbi:FAD-binding oxidoreductase, partial [Halomonas sp. 707D4]